MAYNILIVDDSATVRSMVRKTLRLAGVDTGEVFEAPNGRAALETLQQQWVDLVVTDLNMPEMTGLELVEQMHDHPDLKHLPVVVISAEGNRARQEQLTARPGTTFVRKPFTPELVREAIEYVLEPPSCVSSESTN